MLVAVPINHPRYITKYLYSEDFNIIGCGVEKMILDEETYREFGYYPKELSPRSGKRILAKCDGCGKIREITKHDYRSKCPTCSVVKGTRSNFWKGGKEMRVCPVCKNTFAVFPYRVKICCSIECNGKLQLGESNPAWKGGKIKLQCKECGKEFEDFPSQPNIFCSSSCIGRWRAKHGKGAKSPLWKSVEIKCETCGISFFRIPAHINSHNFCSRECRAIGLSGEKSSGWKGGISFEPYCQKFNNEFKEYIRDKFGRICFLCSKTEEENGRRLSVHHVNYNKGCGCDDDETCQFVPLCVGCNSKVNKNREMWEAKIKAMMKNKLNGWYI